MQPKIKYCLSLFVAFFLAGFSCLAQEIDSTNYPLRKKIVVGGNAVAYSATMVGLYNLWYKDYPLTKFHFFNDIKEWNQMDKVGHAFSCYYEGVAGIEMMKWAGFSEKQSALIGGAYGFFIQTGVEIFDGFSEAWGASLGDVAANTFGATLAITQELAWQEQRVWMKYSWSRSPFDQIRPNVLGSNFPERILKDYNGQIYWASANINAFKPNSKWPKWLNIAVGYGADGMVGGDDNIFTSEGVEYDYTHIARGRQFYISPDIDLTRIKVKKVWQRAGLVVLNSLKFPLPGLEYHTNDGFKAHWIVY